jgi:hypothetical protein
MAPREWPRIFPDLTTPFLFLVYLKLTKAVKSPRTEGVCEDERFLGCSTV